MPRALAPLLLLTLVSCTSMRMAGRDLKAVAQAPAREWKKVAAGTAVVGAALLLDDELARIARSNDSHALDQTARLVEPFGGGHSDKVMAGFLLYGLAGKNQRARDVAFDAFVSSVIASKGITPALKAVVHRERPNGGEDAFASNHATQAFAVASVIAAHYGEERPWVR